jgi:hypothetical protein
MPVTFSLDTSGIEALMRDAAEDLKAAMRPAAQAGAQVLVDEVQRNVNRIGKKTGNLRRSIYQVYSVRSSGSERAVYHVSWNAQKAPHGHLVEFGHFQRYRVIVDKRTGKWVTLKNRPIEPRQGGARPFLRPAAAKMPQALDAAEAVLLEKMKEFK